MPDLLNLLQWPAMVVTVLSAWCVGSHSERQRNWGFWLFLTSNVLWITWGYHDHAYAIVVLQLLLAITNIRGVTKTKQGRA